MNTAAAGASSHKNDASRRVRGSSYCTSFR
jgi:hypothetical protein